MLAIHSTELFWNTYYVCVCITFTQWVEINNQICTSFLIQSTSFLSPQLLARCLCGIHLPALSILHSHPSSVPRYTCFLQLVPQQVQRKAWLMGIINTPAPEHLWGNKEPNSNFNVPSFSGSEKYSYVLETESPPVTFSLQEEMFRVN